MEEEQVAVHPYHDGEARIVPSHRRQEFQLLCYLKANIKDRQYLNLGEFWTEVIVGRCNENTQEQEVKERAGNYSSGRKNSSPNRRISPVTQWRRTLAEIGGVSFGTTLEDEVGDGEEDDRPRRFPAMGQTSDALQSPDARQNEEADHGGEIVELEGGKEIDTEREERAGG